MDSKPKSSRPKLQRSERVLSESHLSSWEVFVRESLLALAWPDLLNVISRTTASDLISRRGVFSRRYYGSVEQLQQPEVNGQEYGRRFRVENGDMPGEKDEMFGSPSTPVLENPEYQTRWYFKYFLGKLHQNYVGLDLEKEPFFLSIVLNENSNQCVPLYRAILFQKTGAQKISLPYSQNKILSVKQILSNFPTMEKVEKGPKEIFAPDLQKDLLLLEEQEGSVNFKFGVIYMKQGQTSDDEILSNEIGSEKFESFLNLLGEKIRLKGWDKYRGGLDVKGDMTGKHSIYTMYEGHEIMFHVSTLLPYSKDNKQQVERKRHIGNDIINIVFIDTNEENDYETETDAHAGFNPNWIKSHFTHVFAVVTINNENQYRLSVFSDETVPLFGPSLPCPAIFKDAQFFREFLLVKLMNGEKATFETPTFARKRKRTLDMLIKDLYSEYMTDTRMTMLNRRAFSDVLAETPKHSKLKEDARQIEFVRIGQALKLEAIVRGDAPTSLASAGSGGSLLRKSPWEPNCFYPVFPQQTIICADSWDDNRLVVATEDGTFVVEDNSSHRLVFDKSLQVKQMSVVESHGIILLRVGPSRDGKIYVYRLSYLDGLTDPKSRMDLKDHRLDKTKGTHLYSISRPGGSRLRMCIAVGRKLVIFQWKHSAAWTAWCPTNDIHTADGFSCLWEVMLNEVPNIMTIVDASWTPHSPSHGDVILCIGYKNHWDLVSGKTGSVQHLHTVEGIKTNLVAALDLYEDQELQLLLCYNHTCHFQKINDENSQQNDFDFHWNSVPTDIVCAFPYLIAFTTNTMEIRLIINGNLVHTMTMPKLKLLSCKNDIFFGTTAPEFFNNKERLPVDSKEKNYSPPASPNNVSPDFQPLRLYRIPIHSLSKQNCNPVRDFVVNDSPKSWKSADSQLLTVEVQSRMSRSATSSPVPPTKGRSQD